MIFKNSFLIFLFTVCIVKCRGWIVFDAFKNVVDTFGTAGDKTNVIFSVDKFNSFSYKLNSMTQILQNKDFNQNIPTVIYIHGYLEDGKSGLSSEGLKTAYLQRNDQNFISIDWSAFSRITLGLAYYSNIPKLKRVCEEIAVQLKKFREKGYQNFYLVGHSLGGQCAGLVGRHLKKITNNQFIIPRIYALDPAKPDFENVLIRLPNHFDRIRKSDAAYVQIIHTNGNLYGLEKPVGHSDFYPNGGMGQPGCFTNVCSHLFAWISYQQSVRDEGAFVARKCDSYVNFLVGECDANEISFMGYSSNGTLPMGTFYLRTDSSNYNSALGFDGIKPFSYSMTYEDGRKVIMDNNQLAFQASKTKLVDHKKGLFSKELSYQKYNEILNVTRHHSRNKKTHE